MSFKSKNTLPLLSAAVFVIVVTIVILVGRNGGQDADHDQDDEYYTPETILFDDQISEPVYDGMPDGISYRKVSTRVTTDTKTGSRLVMNYPVFSGFGESDDEINALILYQNDLMKKINGNGMEKMLGWNVKVIYEVNDFLISYIDTSLISIVFNGVFSSFSEHDHIDTGNYYFKYSINIDIKNKKIITSDEMITNYLLMKSHLIAGDMKAEYLMEDYFKYSTYYDMLLQYGDEYKNYPMIYFSDEKLNIIISLTPDVGGHAVFSYNLKDSKEFIDSSLQPLCGLYS